jgi:aldose 1-epimerase
MTPTIDDPALLPDGRLVHTLTLRAGGAMARVLTLGATLQDMRLSGVAHALTLGTPDPGAYLGPMRYAGAVVGPVANRIGGARVTIAGRTWPLEANRGDTHLHGGSEGLHSRLWQIVAATADAVLLRCDLPDGACGMPGNRRITARYALAPDALTVELRAETDAPTLMNPAAHPYWNLDGSSDIAGHHLRIDASHYLPTTPEGLPTGARRAVAGTPFDFRAGRALIPPDGLDHNFCLSDRVRPLRPVAWLTGRSGLRLTLETTAPGLQVFEGRGFNSAPHAGHGGVPYGVFAGLALEPQLWPDAPNHPDFPSILLVPGAPFSQTSRFVFSHRG